MAIFTYYHLTKPSFQSESFQPWIHRIDFTVIHQRRYTTLFGLVQNDSEWFGKIFRNSLE